MTNHQHAATRAAREAGWTLKTQLDELESALEQQLEHKAMSLAYIREEVMKRGGYLQSRGDRVPSPVRAAWAPHME